MTSLEQAFAALEEMRALVELPDEAPAVRDGRRQPAIDYRLRVMSSVALVSIAESLEQLVALTAEKT